MPVLVIEAKSYIPHFTFFPTEAGVCLAYDGIQRTLVDLADLAGQGRNISRGILVNVSA